MTSPDSADKRPPDFWFAITDTPVQPLGRESQTVMTLLQSIGQKIARAGKTAGNRIDPKLQDEMDAALDRALALGLSVETIADYGDLRPAPLRAYLDEKAPLFPGGRLYRSASDS